MPDAGYAFVEFASAGISADREVRLGEVSILQRRVHVESIEGSSVMYIPAHFAETRLDVLQAQIRRRPLGTLVVATEAGLEANHIPFLLSEAPAPYGLLRGHVARANPVWKHLANAAEVLVVFQGDDAYISPSLYEAKSQDGKVVPTWNYVAVHVYGKARAVADATWLRALVTELTDVHEAGRSAPWHVNDAPDEYTQKLLGAIVGIEISISRLLGKWKVSQNRSSSDRARVAIELNESAPEMSSIVAGTNQK